MIGTGKVWPFHRASCGRHGQTVFVGGTDINRALLAIDTPLGVATGRAGTSSGVARQGCPFRPAAGPLLRRYR